MKLRHLSFLLILSALALAQTYPKNYLLRKAAANAPALLADYDSAAQPLDSAEVRAIVHDTSLAIRAEFPVIPDSVRASHIADTAKRAGWAPLDSVRVRAIVKDTATALRAYTIARVSDTAGVLRTRLADSSSALRTYTLARIKDTATVLRTRLADTSSALRSVIAGKTDTVRVRAIVKDTATVLRARLSDTSAALRAALTDPAEVRAIVHDTADVLRAYARARISDSLTANTRGWTTISAARTAISDSLRVERTFDTATARLVAKDTAGVLRTRISDTSAALRALIAAREPALGNPASNGQALVSTTAGVRSWASMQPLDADLTSIAALSTTAFGRSLLTQADAPTARATLGVDKITTNSVQTTVLGYYYYKVATITANTSNLDVVAVLKVVNSFYQNMHYGEADIFVYWPSYSASNTSPKIEYRYSGSHSDILSVGIVQTGNTAEVWVTVRSDVGNNGGILNTSLVGASNLSLVTVTNLAYNTPPSINVPGVLLSDRVGSLRATALAGTGNRLTQSSSDGTQSASIPVPTAYIQTLLDDADAATARSTLGAGTGNGTVTSVALTPPANMSVSGSPVTGSGTLGLAWNGSSANLVLASGGTIAASSKEPAISAGTTSQYWRGDKTWQDLPTTPSPHTLDRHSNVTITANSSGEVLKWNGTAWVNNTLTEAGIQPLDADLTAIAQVSGSGILEKDAYGVWGLRPIDLQTTMGAGSSGKWAKIITLAWDADINETFSAKLDLVSGSFSIGASQYLIGVDIDRYSGISSFVVKQINGYNFSANRLVAVVTSNFPNAIVVEVWTQCPANYSHIMWNLSSVLKNQYGSNTTLNITQHQGAPWSTSYSSGTVFTGS